MSEPTDSVLDMLLADAGCPYKGGSAEAVIWLQGRVAGLEQAKRDAVRLAYGDNVVPLSRPPRRFRRNA